MAPAQKRALVLVFPLQGSESRTDEGRAREPDRICTQPVPALNPGAHFSALQTYSGRSYWCLLGARLWPRSAEPACLLP